MTFFNTTILTLSLATILITLVAFIIYQVKKLNITNPSAGHGFKLESIFFSSLCPSYRRKIKQWEIEEEQKSRLKNGPSLNLHLHWEHFCFVGFSIVFYFFFWPSRKRISGIEGN